jgi:hypothetical protein
MRMFRDCLVQDLRVDGGRKQHPTAYGGKWRIANGPYSIPTSKKHHDGLVSVKAIMTVNSNSTDARKVLLSVVRGRSDGTPFAVVIDFGLDSGFEHVKRCMGGKPPSTTSISLEVIFGQILGDTEEIFDSYVSPSFVITGQKTIEKILNLHTPEMGNTRNTIEHKSVKNLLPRNAVKTDQNPLQKPKPIGNPISDEFSFNQGNDHYEIDGEIHGVHDQYTPIFSQDLARDYSDENRRKDYNTATQVHDFRVGLLANTPKPFQLQNLPPLNPFKRSREIEFSNEELEANPEKESKKEINIDVLLKFDEDLGLDVDLDPEEVSSLLYPVKDLCHSSNGFKSVDPDLYQTPDLDANESEFISDCLHELDQLVLQNAIDAPFLDDE